MFVIQENKSMQTIISWKWIFDLFIVFKQRTYISRFGINLVKLTKTKQFTGDTHMTSTLRRGGGGRRGGEVLRQKWDVIGRRGWRVSECSGRPIFIFLLKKIGFGPWPGMLMKLPFESDVRQWSHPLMIPLHCLWAKSNNRTRGQFEYDVTLFWVFLFDFVQSRARCGCCSIVCLRFQDVQIKQADC